MKKKWIIITLCAAVLVTAAISIILTGHAAVSQLVDQAGPYKVGFVANTYYDNTRSDFTGGARPIQTFIWYPAAPDNNGIPMLPAVYSMNLATLQDLPDASSTDFEAYGVDPAYQEVTASNHGPFPLVIFSPGAQGDSLAYAQIGTRLASHGFVVAIPTTFDDKFNASGQPEYYPTVEAYMIGTYIERSKDIQYLMTQLIEDSQHSNNLLSGTIQEKKIAVAGHSLGALAAMALAGGDDQACDASMGMNPNNIPPETCVPILPDSRIKAIIPIDGPSYDLHYDEIARIKIPSMVMGQEWSTLESVHFNVESMLARPHSAIQGNPNFRVDFAYANHNSFSSICAYIHVLKDKGIIDDQILEAAKPSNCPPEPLSANEVDTIVTKYMIAFLKTVLNKESTYKEMLTTDYALANEPLIEFFETEKSTPNSTDKDGYFSYFMHQPGTVRATELKDP